MHLIAPPQSPLPMAVVWPEDHVLGTTRLPILLAPYGGPHARRVLDAGVAYATDQWWANQGYCVVIIDGRGTPGRGPAWERTVRGDLASPVLEDQISGLDAVLAAYRTISMVTGSASMAGLLAGTSLPWPFSNVPTVCMLPWPEHPLHSGVSTTRHTPSAT